MRPSEADFEYYDPTEADKAASGDCPAAHCSACADLLRAWDEAVKKWQVNHESIPTDFAGMAAVVDVIRTTA